MPKTEALAGALGHPTISVIVPVYNGAATIASTLRSVFAQTWLDFELIVVDDGSIDDTVAVVDAFTGGGGSLAKQNRRLRLVSQTNQGQAIARNRGIAESRGEFVAFLDADDWWLPQKLEWQLAALRADPAAGLAYCWTELVDNAGQPTGNRVSSPFAGWAYAPLLVTDFVASGSNPLVRRSALEAVGGFNPARVPSEDWDLWLRLAQRYPLALVPEPLVLYRQRPTSSSDNVWRQEAVSVAIIREHLTGGGANLPEANRTESLAPYARFVWGNRYKYLAYKALDAPPSPRRGRTAARYLLQILWRDRGLLKCWPAIGFLMLKILLTVLLPRAIAARCWVAWPAVARSHLFLLQRTLVPRFIAPPPGLPHGEARD